MARHDDRDPLHLLTPREREVLELLRLGLTNGEIAGRLQITLDGAKYHVSEIIGKLGVRDRHEAASYSERRSGWALALAPISFLWRQAGALVSVKASTVALVASAGLGAAALGGIGLIVFFLMQGGGGPGEEVSRQVVSQEDPGRLLAPNRTHLSICVDGAGGGSAGARELDTVAGSVDAALASLEQVPPEFGEPSIVEGCPQPIPLTGERLDYSDRAGFVTLVDALDSPSPHLLFVYFVPDDMYAASFAEEPFAEALAEAICRNPPVTPQRQLFGWRDNVCSPKTLSIYFPESVPGDSVTAALLSVLDLLPPEPEPTFDLPACEQGTPVPGCDRYRTCSVPSPPDPSCYDEDYWESFGLEPPG